jgi:hypothetical protein
MRLRHARVKRESRFVLKTERGSGNDLLFWECSSPGVAPEALPSAPSARKGEILRKTFQACFIRASGTSTALTLFCFQNKIHFRLTVGAPGRRIRATSSLARAVLREGRS